ncbi:Haem-degrading [Azotobacter beijerinckii]|uniref:Haem-degrading n=1 Tax=Azotobacter beijerinckii TaxID=170623 RepID=A0A1H7ABY3_9GAMM|nr:Haem-degrading [Azotobacter beijerinckii]
MPGMTPDNLDWARRKKNVVMRFQRSSYAVGLQLQKDRTTLTELAGLEVREYAPHGGCFPILLRGTGCIGTIAVSGLPQRDDHELIVEVLAEMLEERLEGLALDAET